MEYRLGTSLRIKEKGETVELQCPHCNKKVKFGVFSNMDTHLISEFPLIDSTRIYFLVCPKCASIYTVDENKGDEFTKGEKLAIGNFDLKTLKEFKPKND